MKPEQNIWLKRQRLNQIVEAARRHPNPLRFIIDALLLNLRRKD